MISNFLAQLVDFVWGLPLVILLMGGGFYLLLVSRFMPLRELKRALALVAGKYHHDKDQSAEGQISHF